MTINARQGRRIAAIRQERDKALAALKSAEGELNHVKSLNAKLTAQVARRIALAGELAEDLDILSSETVRLVPIDTNGVMHESGIELTRSDLPGHVIIQPAPHTLDEQAETLAKALHAQGLRNFSVLVSDEPVKCFSLEVVNEAAGETAEVAPEVEDTPEVEETPAAPEEAPEGAPVPLETDAAGFLETNAALGKSKT